MSATSSAQTYSRGPIAGVVFGAAILLSPLAFATHGFLVVFSVVGLAIVLGGVIATAFMSFQNGDVLRALNAIRDMPRQRLAARADLSRDMHDIMRWARGVKTGGPDALRIHLDATWTNVPFANYGLNMVLSGYRPDEIRAMMETAADADYEADCIPIDVLRAMTSHAPAFGMVGTLIGMIAMLCDLNDSMANTGSTLAVAFLSTLYGLVSARMVTMPAAARLQQELDGRQRRYSLITEGMVMLAQGATGSHIHDRLNGFLRPGQHDYFDAMSGSAATGGVTMDPAVTPIRGLRHRPARSPDAMRA